MNVMGTVMTSSPGLTPAAIRARCKSRGPGIDAHAVLGTDIGGERLLELGHLRAQDIGRALGHFMRGPRAPRRESSRTGPCRSRKGTEALASSSGSEDEDMTGAVKLMLEFLTVHVACNTRAGTPATTVPGATSRVTTAPAPTKAPAPMVTPPRITAPLPIEAPRQTRVGNHLPVGLGLEPAVGRRARVEIVDEHDPVADEDLVLDRHALADERVALDLASGADHGVLLDLDEGADPGVVADLASIEVNERVQGDVFAQPDVRRDPDEVGRIRSLVSRRTHCWRLHGTRWKGQLGPPGLRRLRVAASRSRTTRRPSVSVAQRWLLVADALGEVTDHRLQRLARLNVRAPDVAGAVVDHQFAALVRCLRPAQCRGRRS